MTRRRVVSVVLALGVVGLLVGFLRPVQRPEITPLGDVEPDSADAVVMFVGGRGERLTAALALIDAGVADTLLIPNGSVAAWPAANRLCDGTDEASTDADITVLCPIPDPNDTRGEARAIAAAAAENEWKQVVMVTSTYHVARARLRLERCFDGGIIAVAAAPDESFLRGVMRVGHEALGLLEARLVQRGC